MSIYRATVIDKDDPRKRGRLRVWVWGIHKDQSDDIDFNAKLPWAEVACSVQYGDSIHDVGDIVWVMFEQGDLQCPVVIGAARTGTGSTSSINQQVVNDRYYGRTHTFENDAGYLRFNEAEDRILLRTKSGYVVDLNGGDQYLRLITPCCAELNLDCQSQKVQISNGSGLLEMMGTELNFNGTITANMFWTNYGAANSNTGHCMEEYTGLKYNMGSTGNSGNGGNGGGNGVTQGSQSTTCNPTTNNNGTHNNCNSVSPPNTSTSSLETKLRNVIQAAYDEANNNNDPFYISEGKMDNQRYICLKRANAKVHVSMIEGKGVRLATTAQEANTNISGGELAQADGVYYDTNDKFHFTLDGKPAPYKSNNADVRALTRMLYGEVSVKTDGTGNFKTDAAHNVASIIFNRVANGCGIVRDSATVVGVIDAGNGSQFSYNLNTASSGGPKIRNMKGQSAAKKWDQANDLAIKYYNDWKQGKWTSSVGKAVLYANLKSASSTFKNNISNGNYIPVFGNQSSSTDNIGHTFFLHKGCY